MTQTALDVVAKEITELNKEYQVIEQRMKEISAMQVRQGAINKRIGALQDAQKILANLDDIAPAVKKGGDANGKLPAMVRKPAVRGSVSNFIIDALGALGGLTVSEIWTLDPPAKNKRSLEAAMSYLKVRGIVRSEPVGNPQAPRLSRWFLVGGPNKVTDHVSTVKDKWRGRAAGMQGKVRRPGEVPQVKLQRWSKPAKAVFSWMRGHPGPHTVKEITVGMFGPDAPQRSVTNAQNIVLSLEMRGKVHRISAKRPLQFVIVKGQRTGVE